MSKRGRFVVGVIGFVILIFLVLLFVELSQIEIPSKP